MVLYSRVRFKTLERLGKEYRWQRPQSCPGCGSQRLYGHGYVQRYFDCLSGPVWVRRYRCAECGKVHTLRPARHWRKFLAPIESVVRCLRSKIETNRWVDEWSRQRQQYWWRGFLKRLLAAGFIGRPSPEQLWQLLRGRIIAATHSLKYFDTRRVIGPSYRTFAFTPARAPS